MVVIVVIIVIVDAEIKSLWLSEWVIRSPIELSWTAKNLNSHLRLLQVIFKFFDRPEQQMVMPTTQEGLHSRLPHTLMQGTKSQTFSRQAKLDEKIN